MGILGIAVETFIGAVLYEYVNRNGPFNLFAASCFVGIIIAIIIYSKAYRKSHPTNPSITADLLTEEQSVDPIEPKSDNTTV